jgi:hypothetical protein
MDYMFRRIDTFTRFLDDGTAWRGRKLRGCNLGSMSRLFCKTSRIAAARRTKINIAGEWTAHYGLHRPTGYGGDERRGSHRGGA